MNLFKLIAEKSIVFSVKKISIPPSLCLENEFKWPGNCEQRTRFRLFERDAGCMAGKRRNLARSQRKGRRDACMDMSDAEVWINVTAF